MDTCLCVSVCICAHAHFCIQLFNPPHPRKTPFAANVLFHFPCGPAKIFCVPASDKTPSHLKPTGCTFGVRVCFFLGGGKEVSLHFRNRNDRRVQNITKQPLMDVALRLIFTNRHWLLFCLSGLSHIQSSKHFHHS